MKRLLLALLIALIPGMGWMGEAHSQGTVLQGGPWQPGHFPVYSATGDSQPTVVDSGPASGGAPGVGIDELAITLRGTGSAPWADQGTGPLFTNFCNYDAPTTNPTGFHYLCMSPNAQGGGLIAYGAAGGASNLPFKFAVNGTTYEFPFVIGGIVGPGSSTVGDMACWNNGSGTLLSDCGPPLVPPASSQTGGMMLFANTTGKLAKDGGLAPFISPTAVDWGAVCNGVNDATTALNAALASGNGLVMTGRNLICRVSATIIIPAGTTLDMGNFIPGNPVQGSQILCEAAVAVCVQLGTGGTNGTAALRNAAVTRVAGTPGSTTVGIHVLDGYNVVVNNVISSNHGICWRVEANPGSGGLGLGMVVTGGYSSMCVDAHLDYDSWPELKWIGGRFGQNGLGDYASTTMIRIRGGAPGTAGGPNTLVFDDVQFNHGSTPAQHLVQWIDCTAPCIPSVDGTQLQFTNSHAENFSVSFFTSDASWNIINRFRVTNTTFNNPAIPMFTLDAGSQPSQWDLIGNYYFVSTFNLAPTAGFNSVNIIGGYLGGTMDLTGQAGSTVNITNLVHGGDFTLNGDWGAFNSFGETWTAGQFINSATGFITTYTTQGNQGAWVPLLAIGGSTAGIVQDLFYGDYQVNNRTVTASFTVRLTNKGAGTGTVTITGLPFNDINNAANSSGGGGLADYANVAGLTGAILYHTQGGTANMLLQQSAATGMVALTEANITNTTLLKGTVTYFYR